MSEFKAFKIDKFGVKNYNSFYLMFITLILLYAIIGALSFALLHFELQALDANIVTYKDAFWALQMSASTIGFGDFYPVTFGGRMIVSLMFYIGVGMVGFIGAQFVNKFVGFSDTNIKNRELRHQNAKILMKNQELDVKMEYILTKLDSLNSDK